MYSILNDWYLEIWGINTENINYDQCAKGVLNSFENIELLGSNKSF